MTNHAEAGGKELLDQVILFYIQRGAANVSYGSSPHAGQRVRFSVDAYSREYQGRVTGIGGASGSRFSLLPPENATGNYVKVVQRIPVRIDLDPGQNADRHLRPGMSVDPKVYLR